MIGLRKASKSFSSEGGETRPQWNAVNRMERWIIINN